jgi:LuxR family maltose regulon positive regulatory protein
MTQNTANEQLRLNIESNQRLQPVIPRSRLLEFIEAPFAAPITLISAPAGFGKTTLAAQWAEHAGRRSIWASLQTDANSPDRLLATLVTGARAAGVLQAIEASSSEMTIDTFADELLLAAEAQPLALILDDYHEVDSLDVHRLVNELLNRCSARIPVFLLSRERLPFALSRQRLSGQVREITEDQLRFLPHEIVSVVDLVAPKRLDHRQIDRLGQRTDGWIAGIRLALMAMDHASRRQIDTVIEKMSSERWLQDYVVEEVIDQLSDPLRAFVLRTAALKFLDPDLCNAVLGIDESADLIDELIRRNVFLQRMSGEADSYTYYPLFAEFVERISVRRLPPAERQALHQRAAAWLNGHGHGEFALEQMIKSGNIMAAVDIMVEVGAKLTRAGRHRSLYYWLSKLPETAISSNSLLAAWYIRMLLQLGRTRDASMMLQHVAPDWHASNDPYLRAIALSLQGLVSYFNGYIDEGLERSVKSLYWLPGDAVVERLRAWGEIITYEQLRGNDEEMWHAYRQAEWCKNAIPGQQVRWIAFIEPDRVNWSALRGDLFAAERALTYQLERFPKAFEQEEPKLRIRLAAIYLEWNQLARASEELDHFVRDMESFSSTFWVEEGQIVRARLLWAQGERAAAAESLQNAIDQLTTTGGPMMFYSAMRALQAAFWLESGEIDLARDWYRTRPQGGYQWPMFFGSADAFSAQVQLAIAERDFGAASTLARQCIAQAHTLKQRSATVPLYLWDFVAQSMLGNDQAACDALREALTYAMPGGFVRAFLLPDPTIVSLYERIMPRLSSDEAAYLRRVIASGYGGETATEEEPAPNAERAPTNMNLREALSRRERDVLKLLADGLRNREIGERLFISERTVKKHMTSLMAKLDATSRATALKHAREMELL